MESYLSITFHIPVTVSEATEFSVELQRSLNGWKCSDIACVLICIKLVPGKLDFHIHALQYSFLLHS